MGIEITERIRCARLWCQRYWKLLCNPDLRCQTKFCIYKLFVRPILSYGCEVWILNNRLANKLIRFECGILIEIYKSKYPHRHPKRLRPNIRSVYKQYHDSDIVDYIRNERLNWRTLLKIEEKAISYSYKKTGKRVHWWDQSADNSDACNSSALQRKIIRPILKIFTGDWNSTETVHLKEAPN
ncbi:unnamed protein product [Diatraea saccharalis]|uniref:Uncharacterized protein n=1 Tax=Diatraea saccharalis TaxID=40085 RepID=A0A9N9R1Y4_9NEOP|nr:unnamed protein product [Diatraea saccharalis]